MPDPGLVVAIDIWADGRASVQARRLRDSGQWLGLHRRTGTPLHPMSPLVKLLWFRAEAPDVGRRAARWTRFLEFDPAEPEWFDRDRFVLSNGHASVLQYAVLHLTGYPLGIRDLKQQRMWGSLTPGHPEYGHTPGVEVTTGPLGQGVGNGVGFAIAERLLAARYNRPGQELVDHRTWVFCADGDMMEGVASEVSSLAGHLRLGKLTLVYDDNHITIDGPTGITFTEDVARRYQAYGWHVQHVEDANDLEAIAAAYQAAVDEPDRPSFIRLRSLIAWGAPNAQGTSKAHGAALGEDEVRATKEAYGWNPDRHFKVPDGVPERWQVRVPANQAARADWERRLAGYAEAEPELAAELRTAIAGELPAGWDAGLEGLFAEPEKQATRKASQQAINAVAPRLPMLVGGSADLAAHGGLRPFCATFLVFSDYMRPSVRLAALMGLPVVYVWTHDSVGLGGDGPTHQPIEHLNSLRLLPNLHVIRPADGPETAEASGGQPELILLATGSEVRLALAARDELEQRQEVPTRVVSMPCWELFEAQPESYRDQVLPPLVTARLAVEAGSTGLWHKWVGTLGGVVGIDQFGASAPGGTALIKFGFTEDNVVERALAVLHREHVEKARMLRNLSA